MFTCWIDVFDWSWSLIGFKIILYTKYFLQESANKVNIYQYAEIQSLTDMSSKEAKRTFLTPWRNVMIFSYPRNQIVRSKSISMLNFSLLAVLKVVCLLYVLQGSQEDVPDS